MVLLLCGGVVVVVGRACMHLWPLSAILTEALSLEGSTMPELVLEMDICQNSVPGPQAYEFVVWLTAQPCKQL